MRAGLRPWGGAARIAPHAGSSRSVPIKGRRAPSHRHEAAPTHAGAKPLVPGGSLVAGSSEDDLQALANQPARVMDGPSANPEPPPEGQTPLARHHSINEDGEVVAEGACAPPLAAASRAAMLPWWPQRRGGAAPPAGAACV